MLGCPRGDQGVQLYTEASANILTLTKSDPVICRIDQGSSLAGEILQGREMVITSLNRR